MAEKTLNSKFYKPQSQAVGGETYLKLAYDPKTGDTRLLQYNTIGGAVGVSFEIYKNGVWGFNPGAVATVDEKNKVHQQVQDYFNKNIKGVPGNILPSFVTQNAPSKDQGFSGQPTLSQSSGLLAATQNASSNFGEDPSKNFEVTKNEKSLFGDVTLLTYPRDILKSKQDTLRISQYRYKAPANNIFTNEENRKGIFTKGLQRNSAITDLIGKVILPMPNEVVDINGVDWGSSNMDNRTLGMASYGYNNLAANALGTFALGAGALAITTRTKGLINLDTGALSGIAAEIAAGGFDLNRPDMKAIIASTILKGQGFDISPETILQRGFGVVPNSNLELLFNGPKLRGFSFNYKLSPRNEKEASNVRRILRFFKQGMAARKSNNNGSYSAGGSASLLLGTPNIFKLNYKTDNDKNIEGVNKFKLCALTNFQVNYTPDGQWSAYEKGQPTSVIMSMQFSEIEPIYNNDYQETVLGEFQGKDLEPITKEDVGY